MYLSPSCSVHETCTAVIFVAKAYPSAMLLKQVISWRVCACCLALSRVVWSCGCEITGAGKSSLPISREFRAVGDCLVSRCACLVLGVGAIVFFLLSQHEFK